jgi:hypothetical protein
MVTTPQEQEPNYQEPTEEDIRRALVQKINVGATREELELAHSKVWDTAQLSQNFTVIGFKAPFVEVEEKVSGVAGSLMFQASPRFYFDFQEDK